ncbi:hypothetical protein BH23ACT12_BH23ACT12_04780 [soil metagenome]
MHSLAGETIGPGEEATASLDLKAARTCAYICVIPEMGGDVAPHITKGMFTHRSWFPDGRGVPLGPRDALCVVPPICSP